MTHPWPAGSATGIGSLPGIDAAEAARLVFGELGGLPHLPELPARGAGAEMVGRTAALLVDLPVEIAPSGWRFTSHVGRDVRRARDYLARDLDALETQADGFSGALKVQVAGPWTLAAHIELATGHRVLRDYGATRDLADSLAEGVAAHLAEVSRRVPNAHLVVQFDEPSLPAVLAGTLPTASGYGTLRAIEGVVAQDSLRSVLAVAPEGGRVVHCCAGDVPIRLLRDAGANAVAVDAALLERSQYDALGEAVDAGVALWLGVLPSTDDSVTLDTARDPIHRLWSELGFPATSLAASVVPTPSCGMAGATPDYVRRVLSLLRDAGHSLLDLT